MLQNRRALLILSPPTSRSEPEGQGSDPTQQQDGRGGLGDVFNPDVRSGEKRHGDYLAARNERRQDGYGTAGRHSRTSSTTSKVERDGARHPMHNACGEVNKVPSFWIDVARNNVLACKFDFVRFGVGKRVLTVRRLMSVRSKMQTL